MDEQMNNRVLENEEQNEDLENEDLQNEEWHRKRLERNARKRERRQQAKMENPELESAKRREEREKAKSLNPNYTTEESAKRQERKLKAKTLNPVNEKRQIFNDLFDKLFEENKHTFPTPVSKKEWERLKKADIDFLFNSKIFPDGHDVWEIMEDRKRELEELRENSNHPCAPSIIFYIKTLVHRPKDNFRKLTPEEIEWLHSVELNDKGHETKKRIYDPEKKRQQNKEYYEKTKLNQKTVNLNLRFMRADPNKVLSIDEITNNPFVSNFSQREAYKIQLWKQDQNLEDLDKWRKQREAYEMEVEELSIEYKEEFLKGR